MRQKTILVLMTFLLAVPLYLFLMEGASYAAAKESPAEKKSCVTSACHSTMNKVKYRHGPVEAGECAECHGTSSKHPSDPKKYKFEKIKNVSAKCYGCHDKFAQKKYTHAPVKDGECLACHNPHGSNNKFQLAEKGAKVCFNCHDDGIVGGTFVHGPAAVGGCIACHEPHVSDNENSLRSKGSELCYLCHVEKADAINKAAFVHKPVAIGCTGCHNPHSGPKEFFLPSESPTLCLGCHKDKKEQLSNIKVKHGALERDKSCLNCHDAHIAQVAKNLLMEPMDLCISCHDREYKRKNDRSVPDIKTLLAENKDHHGPIKQKDCSGCHDPHGSNDFRILRNYYPETFYKPFDITNYSLCFSCHEKTVALDPKTTKLTNFRNGNENLHFLHVNKPIKGRTCRACHETHASNWPKHIREAVPFGAWDLPLNFEKTETGGSCTPGCHKIKLYDRIKRVENK
jgi:predicted CXXCH cytochrome family protein